MTWTSFIFFAAFISLALTLLKRGTDIFSPARLYIMIWSLILGLTELKLSGWQKEWSAYSWLIILMSISSVLLGMFIVYVINFNGEQKPIPSTRKELIRFEMDKKQISRIIVLLFISYIISYIAIYLIVGFIPFFTKYPDRTRTHWQFFGFSLLIHLVPPLIYAIALYYLKARAKISENLFVTSILLISLISYFFLLQRFDLVIPIILFVVFLYYGTNKFKPRYIFIILLILIILIYSISTLRNSNLFIAILYYTGKMRFSKNFAIFTEPYMYLVMNLENFANAAERLTQFSYGYYTFDFVLALTGLKHWIYDYYPFVDFPYIITPLFNTYTMFFSYYRDFGALGIFVIPAFIGALISHSYFQMRKHPNLYTISLYGMSVVVIIFSYFITMLSWLFFVFIIIVIAALTKVLIKKRGQITSPLKNS